MQTSIKGFEIAIAKVLRGGVFIVAILLTIGWLMQINLTENVFLQFQSYQDQNFMETLKLAWVENSWGVLISYLGLVILVSLPVIRVLMTIYLFALQKDFKMMLICTIVIIGLTLSVVLGAIE